MGWFGSHFWEGPSSHVEQKMYQSFSPVLLRLVLVYAWSSLVEGNEQPDRHNTQSNMYGTYHLGRYNIHLYLPPRELHSFCFAVSFLHFLTAIWKMGYSRQLYSLFFVFSIQLTLNIVQYKLCRWYSLRLYPLESSILFASLFLYCLFTHSHLSFVCLPTLWFSFIASIWNHIPFTSSLYFSIFLYFAWQ